MFKILEFLIVLINKGFKLNIFNNSLPTIALTQGFRESSSILTNDYFPPVGLNQNYVYRLIDSKLMNIIVCFILMIT